MIARQWANAEFTVLGQLYLAGSVPYPVQVLGTRRVLLEFIPASPTGPPRRSWPRPDRRA